MAMALLMELPDQGQNLFIQRSKEPLKVFTLFSLLPVELRRKIWRAALPQARKFLIKWYSYDASIYWQGALCYSFNTKGGPLLNTLHVNNESREETLRHYSILLPHFKTGCSDNEHIERVTEFNTIYNKGISMTCTKKKHVSRPLVIDFNNDTVYYPFKEIFRHSFTKWAAFQVSQYPDFFKSLQRLELLHNTPGPDGIPAGIGFPFMWKWTWTTYNTTARSLKYFTGLKELVITFQDFRGRFPFRPNFAANSAYIASEEGAALIEEEVRKYLLLVKKDMTEYSIPKVTIQLKGMEYFPKYMRDLKKDL